MKRVLTILAILLLPLSVWAMTPIADSDLSNVTGQAGVNINANVTMDIAIGTMAWGDADGLTGVYDPWDVNGLTTAGGYVGMSNFNIYNLSIKARTESTDSYNGYNTLFLKPITIDVATANAAITVNQGGTYGLTESMATGTTFVRFGLGALQINMDAMSFDVGLGPRPEGTAATVGTTAVTTLLTQNLGQVSLGAMAMYINPFSYVDIFSAAGAPGGALSAAGGDASGVDFAVNVTIDKFSMNYMSWGDTDGLVGGNIYTNTTNSGGGTTWIGSSGVAAGYVGLSSFLINGPIAINGQVQIDVTNVSSGVYAQLPTFVGGLVTSLNTYGGGNAVAKAITNGLFASGYSGVDLGIIAAYVYSNTGGATNPIGLYVQYVEGGGTQNFGVWMAANYPAYLSTAFEQLALGWALTGEGTSAATPTAVVHISFPTNFIFNIEGAISANVALAGSADLTTTNPSVLGDIYLSGLKFTVHQSSWVDIWAH
jgi:hypothetical protein